MKPSMLGALALFVGATFAPLTPAPREGSTARLASAKLVRYPHAHGSRIAFTYLGDIWTAEESGANPRRLTVHAARDVYARFSPDGQWIAFSSDREGNLDVYLMPAGGGNPKQLTFHSADDNVLGWTPDGKSVLFASNRAEDWSAKLYTVPIDAGDRKNGVMPRSVGVDMGVAGSFSPDGRKLAYNRRSQAYWRKFYRGSAASDVTIMDVASKTFRDVTEHSGIDSWPMYGTDGWVYFVSDREGNGAVSNIYRVKDTGGAAEKITTFSSGEVRWPSISTDGRSILFEHDFGLWKLDVGSKRASAIPLDIAAEMNQSASEMRTFSNESDDYDLAPNGRRIVFSIHGEMFTAPVDEGELVQLTESPWRDRNPTYSPDGRWVSYVSDESGREEIYVKAADGSGAARKLTDIDALKFAHVWSPDSRSIAFTSSDNVLRVVSGDGGRPRDIASSRFGNIGAPAWSPDGRWLVFSRNEATRTGELFVVSSAGGEEQRITFDSYTDAAPAFSSDGRTLYFVRVEGVGQGGGGQQQSHLWAMGLVRETRDPMEPDEVGVGGGGRGVDGDSASMSARRVDTMAVRERPAIQYDWVGVKRRTRQVTNMPFSINSFAVSPSGRTLAFVTTEPSAQRTIPVVYAIRDDGRRLTRVLSGSGGADGEGGGGGGGGGGAGLSALQITRDGRTVFFRERRGIYSAPMPNLAGSATAGTGTGGPTTNAPRRQVSFTTRVAIDKPAEWLEMFDDAWRTMKYRFYDSRMHGMDWDSMRNKYRPLVAHVGDRQELLNVVNEMIGELNASHTGAAPPPGGGQGGVQTGYLGVELAPDADAGRYRVTHVFEGGPADKDWVRVSSGDYLVSINGTPVSAGDNYWKLLNHRLNRKVAVSFSKSRNGNDAWTTRIEPVTQGAHNQLRYERWVAERKVMTDSLSGGRVAYLHIQAMNQPSLRKFEKELREARSKDALVIDQRWNGGGNIEQELIALLGQREYQIWQPRGTEASSRPAAGFFGPKVVLQNWRSGSNAEMFPAAFKKLGLGKTIGEPTVGAVIGTGSYTLIDGSTVRTPGVGVFLADDKRTNMENYGVPPDILIESRPEDHLANRDKQLERAVQELLKEIGPRQRADRGGTIP
jgi:tricorn protease